MKLILLLAAVALPTSPCLAETNFIELAPIGLTAVTNNADPILTTNRDEFGIPIVIDSAKRRALKDYFEKLPSIPFARQTEFGFYDLTDVWKIYRDGIFSFRALPEKMIPFVIEGRVVQVIKDGLLVKEAGNSDLTFVKNYPGKERLIDNDEIRFVCVRGGRYVYTSTTGATTTIAKADCGTGIAAGSIPEQIVRVTTLGSFKMRRP